ncbi:MAG TPA: DUF1289 domain-containing protein [Xanthobacteraceae bacterium]|nr:DUF1289 domain-containing protein [Xanthobacteraceae bacterium]
MANRLPSRIKSKTGFAGSCQALPSQGQPLSLLAIHRRGIVPAIESPCTKVCIINPAKGFCMGCGRSLSEISAWSSLSGDVRARLMADLPRRLAAALPAQAVPPPSP